MSRIICRKLLILKNIIAFKELQNPGGTVFCPYVGGPPQKKKHFVSAPKRLIIFSISGRLVASTHMLTLVQYFCFTDLKSSQIHVIIHHVCACAAIFDIEHSLTA